MENRFFSGMVRIQTERGHRVVSSGPYPLDTPSRLRRGAADLLGHTHFLDSTWTFLPVIFLSVVLVIRTRLEDRTLQDKLEGYREYAGRGALSPAAGV